MDIRELKSFLVLAEQLHFGRAAGLMNLSQPALTKQIRRMEEELGAPLFERSRHGTRLSVFGESFLREARETVRSFDELLDHGRRVAKGEEGRLSLGFGFHTFELVPRLIVRLRKVAPGIEVSLRDMSTVEQVEALQAGRIDLGFVRAPVTGNFRTLPVVRDRLALISSAASGLPAGARLADCRDEPFVAISEKRSPSLYRHMLALCRKHGFHPRVVQQVPEMTTALALVQAGLGVALISESFWSGRFEGVRLHRLREKEAGWQVHAAWKEENTNPALKRMLALLKEELNVTR